MLPIVDTVLSWKVEFSASCHELPSFLRNKRDVFPSSLQTLPVLSSNAKFNWGLIINTPHALVLLIYANLFQGFLFVIFSKWIISSSPTSSRAKGEKIGYHMNLKTPKVVREWLQLSRGCQFKHNTVIFLGVSALNIYGCAILRQPNLKIYLWSFYQRHQLIYRFCKADNKITKSFTSGSTNPWSKY